MAFVYDWKSETRFIVAYSYSGLWCEELDWIVVGIKGQFFSVLCVFATSFLHSPSKPCWATAMVPAMNDSTLSSAAMISSGLWTASSTVMSSFQERDKGRVGRSVNTLLEYARLDATDGRFLRCVFLNLRRIVDHVCARAWYAGKKTCGVSRSLQHVVMTDS